MPIILRLDRVMADRKMSLNELSEKVGVASLYLGAGRNSKEDKIDYKAGITLNKKVGDRVEKGDVLCALYANDLSLFEKSKQEFLSAITISDEKPIKTPLIIKTISAIRPRNILSGSLYILPGL